ncbi:phenylacetic acid degradation bifunctional protein PaaZ [Sulfitobacter albidus]|uniref:Phenylacetic acid degradation bifunctional protein PaaZ n=1 Tax=Sulfitobacter albidus TaxID=2829501 RepID=A0A975JFC0_9RHOB|nr:phenylacetic acid degradation bifunctional protein PaaZ [Sulfitobacter albidus]QUJ77474.1 phenylacetic acid degradation bifunctional protein PaaZ [Sulfitobacter albidus]
MIDVHSFAAGHWTPSDSAARPIACAITGEIIARSGNGALDVGAMHAYAREVGGPALRKLTFHDRARMLKALAIYLGERKQALYDLSFHTGATQADHAFDIDGGIGTMFVYASKGRREMPDARIYLDGEVEQLGREGTFLGRHVAVPLQGVGVHINAFNFPVWGMLEKFAPTFLAGVPSIVKPATATSYVTEACVRMMLESGILPDGALQLIAGGTGDLLKRLDAQDVVSFTGSADTALKLRSEPHLLANAVRFVAEQDSLNASVLGPDAAPGTPEFDLFVTEAHREMTTKAGQKCTAIRRIMAPATHVDALIAALSERLQSTQIGDPRDKATRMGALVSTAQRADVLEKVAALATEAERVSGDPDSFRAPVEGGAFLPPMLFHCADPDAAERLHDTEAFGPVSTIMPYRDADHAIALLNRGKGSLVASVITRDTDLAREMVLGAAAWHGRLYFNNRDSMAEATGHGAPMPHMVHGGPGRAGGGEELGGIRGVMHYMQRTAVQGSPDILTAVGAEWIPGATETTASEHPFTKTFHDLAIGETLHTDPREVTLDDIETFAHFTGDTFYAHMDEEAAKANPFFPGRVAHGYLLLSFAAGLFVQPDPGPVLANTGLGALTFLKPVSPGDTIAVRLTVKKKTPRTDTYGQVRWHVTVTNQDAEKVAEYELHTMNAYS